jgi:hypothetical protein
MTLPAVDVPTEFRVLAERWHGETDDLSSATRVVGHPAYLRMIGLGREALPHILRDLEANGGMWFAALEAVTGLELGTPDERSNYRTLREVWLRWGRDNGYL